MKIVLEGASLGHFYWELPPAMSQALEETFRKNDPARTPLAEECEQHVIAAVTTGIQCFLHLNLAVLARLVKGDLGGFALAQCLRSHLEETAAEMDKLNDSLGDE